MRRRSGLALAQRVELRPEAQIQTMSPIAAPEVPSVLV